MTDAAHNQHSNIKIEVWMPYSGWNGRFLGTGNGNIGGLINYLALGFFLPLNYAVANTDMGTSPAATDPLGGRVLTGHPEKQIDFATRCVANSLCGPRLPD